MKEVNIQSHICPNLSVDIGWPLHSTLSLIMSHLQFRSLFPLESPVAGLSSPQGDSITEWVQPFWSLPLSLSTACP